MNKENRMIGCVNLVSNSLPIRFITTFENCTHFSIDDSSFK